MTEVVRAYSKKITDNWFSAALFAGLTYYLVASLGTIFYAMGSLTSPIWPATGIGLALILILGGRVWPGIFIANFLISPSLVIEMINDPLVLIDRPHTVINSFLAIFHPLLGAWLIKKDGLFPQDFSEPIKIVKFYFYGAVVTAIAASTLGNLNSIYFEQMSADNFLREWLIWCVADISSVIVFTTLVVAIISFKTRRKIAICFTLIASFSISMAIYLHGISWNDERLDLLFERQTAEIVNSISEKIESYRAIIIAMDGFLQSHELLTRAGFDKFSNKILENNSDIKVVNFVKTVLREDFESFNAKLNQEYEREVIIRNLGADGLLEFQTDEIYQIVEYISPARLEDVVVGVNITTEPIRIDAYEHAARHNTVALTAPQKTELIQDGLVLSIFYPYYDTTALQGFSLISVYIDGMISDIYQRALDSGIYFSIQDIANDGTGIDAFNVNDLDKANGIFQVFSIPMLNRTGQITAYKGDLFTSVNANSQVAFIGIGGMIIASLISFGIIILSGQREFLEAQVRRRTRELEVANQSKSEFLANMSHDLRTPLNAIIGFSEIMNKQIFGKVGSVQYEGYIKDINQASEYLLSLINDILDFSTIEAGKRELVLKDVNIKEKIDKCFKSLGSLILKKNLICTNQVTPDHEMIKVDERALMQILVNLISNSIKFSDTGGTININVVSDKKNYIIDVIDTGRGIHPEYLSTILDPFTRAENDPEIAHEGTGLGLAIVNSLVILHGGELIIHSVVDQGTKVTILIPKN